MNLINLKYFYDSARLGSMTKAADLNHISRPAISQSIKKLEDELNISLLNHKRRGLELTESGKLLLENARFIFAQVDKVKSQLSSKGPLSGTIKIGSARTLATFGLQKAFSKFRKNNESVSLVIKLGVSQDLVQLLVNREIDLAILIGDEVEQGFRQEVLGRGHFCLVKPKSLLAGTERFALTEKRPETDRLRVLFERKYSKSLPVFAEISSWDAIWTWVRHGICGGLIPDFLLKTGELSPSKYSVIIDKVWPYEIKIMYPESRSSDPMLRAMIDCLQY